MRLGQLAKQIGARPGEIVAFLKSQNLPITIESNNRLTEEQVNLVLQYLRPANSSEVTESEGTTDTQPAAEQTTSLEGEIINQGNEPPETASEPEKIEVIRAPKVELSGLKVVGKIELPEIPKKAKPAQTTETDESSNPSGQQKERAGKKYHSPRKNPIVLQREREAREAEEKRRLEKERQKERRKNHYESQLKESANLKPVRKPKKEPVANAEPSEEQPKTWLVRLWKWFRN